MPVETEIKLRVDDLAAIKKRLHRLGWRVADRRKIERNWVFDRQDGLLRRSNRLLRVRRVGKTAWLTVKGPAARETAHKVRDEFEIETGDGASLMSMLEALDYRVTWCYEKYRSGFTKPRERGKILLDETPIGNFLELEGPAAWVDATARSLDFEAGDYITLSYRRLFEAFRRKHCVAPDMVFEK